MKKLLIFTIAVTLISILINAKINASSLIDEFDDSRGFEFIGVYETYTMENHIEKVYISEEIKNIYDSNNIDYYAQVSSFGTIFANNSGTVTISGINKYNSRYRVSIIITII